MRTADDLPPTSAVRRGPAFVNGTLMRGLELHANLAGPSSLASSNRAAVRIFSIEDVHPGMYEVDEGGISFQASSTSCRRRSGGASRRVSRRGLYRGPVELEDGRIVPGILYPREMVEATIARSRSSAAGAGTSRSAPIQRDSSGRSHRDQCTCGSRGPRGTDNRLWCALEMSWSGLGGRTWTRWRSSRTRSGS